MKIKKLTAYLLTGLYIESPAYVYDLLMSE